MVDKIFNFIFISSYNRKWMKKFVQLLNKQKNEYEGALIYNQEFSKFLIKNAVKWFTIGFIAALAFLYLLLYTRTEYPFIIIGLILIILVVIAFRSQKVLKIGE